MYHMEMNKFIAIAFSRGQYLRDIVVAWRIIDSDQEGLLFSQLYLLTSDIAFMIQIGDSDNTLSKQWRI